MFYFRFDIVSTFPYGLAVRIPGFHPGGPGSTPGMGRKCVLFFFLLKLSGYIAQEFQSFALM